MKIVFSLIGLTLIFVTSAYAREVIDSTGVKVAVTDNPRRIVTLAPSLGELLSDLYSDELGRIVGVSDYTDYPPALKKVESVGPYPRINLEKVVVLKPDVVFATFDGNSKEQILHLRDLKVPVVVVKTQSLQEIYESIRIVSFAVGQSRNGENIINQLKVGISHLSSVTAQPKKKVFLQLGDDPIITVGKAAFLNEILEIAGASNIYSDIKQSYPRPSREDVVSRNPDVIIVLALNANLPIFVRMANKWKSFLNMKAIENRSVHILKSDALLRPTLRLLEGIESLKKAIYEK